MATQTRRDRTITFRLSPAEFAAIRRHRLRAENTSQTFRRVLSVALAAMPAPEVKPRKRRKNPQEMQGASQ